MLKNKINEKIYIGQTTRPIKKRLEEHQQKSSCCVAIYRAIHKHGWGNFDKDWYECPDDDLNFYEEMLVALLGTLAPGGYNLREGGGANGKMSEETKIKMREAHCGKNLSEETKQKLREANVGKKHTNGAKQKMSVSRRGEKNHMYGKIHTEGTKQKMSEAQRGDKGHWYGKTHTEETKQKMSEAQRGENNPIYGINGEKHHCSKKVYQYRPDGTFVRSFGSAREAGRYLKKDASSISKCACGDRGFNSAYGFKWYYNQIT